MESVWTGVYLAMAVGLAIEAVLAFRRRRILPSTQLPFVIGIGGLGVVSVVSKSVGSDAGLLRLIAGLSVLAAFIACLAIDLGNRRATRSRTGT